MAIDYFEISLIYSSRCDVPQIREITSVENIYTFFSDNSQL